MNKKVLFVVDERKLGGVSVLLENILNNLELDSVDKTVLVLHNSGTRLENIDAKVIYGTKALDIIDEDLKSLIKNFKFVKAIKKIMMSLRLKLGGSHLRRFIGKQRKKLDLTGYDIEIAFKAGFCSAFVALGDSKTKINWVHEDYATYNRTKRYENTFKEIFNLFDKHIVVSCDAKNSFCNIYGNLDKTFVIENYIDTISILDKAKDAPTINVDKTKLNFVTLGRFSYEKGFDRIINAFNKLKEEGTNLSLVHMYIVGYGDEEKNLLEDIKRLNLTEYIDIINSSTLNYNPYAFMKECDIYVMPSRSESFGMVRVEAMTLRLPVITTDVANTDKLLKNKYGIVVDNSTEGIYNGLKEVITNNDTVLSLKKNIIEYSYDEKNNEILNEIKLLLEE